jgi:penicillin-binding protein 1A
VAEMQRIAELKRTNPAAAAAELGESKPASPIMTAPARDALKRITAAMRKAAGIEDPATPGVPTPSEGQPGTPQGIVPRGNRADADPAGPGDLARSLQSNDSPAVP